MKQDKHIHILGICGTFMGGLAQLAQAQGHRVSGCDNNVYPPMSDQLEQAGIEVLQDYKPEHLQNCNNGCGADLVVIGNAMSRGNPIVEAVLNSDLPYQSGPQWLAEHVLAGRWVLAVAGTHGKTTTASMLTWILESAGLQPGFLIGGVPSNFGVSARLGESPFFVIEADEYDTAFFDKRSKFVHYHPRTLVLNNLEFDHADIFPDLDAIKRQFHHLIRIVPSQGRIVVNADDDNLADVLRQGCWTPQECFGLDDGGSSMWQVTEKEKSILVKLDGESVGSGSLSLPGKHNALNALSAIAAARHVGVRPHDGIGALSGFRGVKRRLEVIGEKNDIIIYDDFAHHPTAISATLNAMRDQIDSGRLLVLLEPRSNTMRMGVHNKKMQMALSAADLAWVYLAEGVAMGLEECLEGDIRICHDLDKMIERVAAQARPKDKIVLMSNGGFDGAHAKLLRVL